MLLTPGSPTGRVAVWWGCSRHAYRLSALPDSEPILTASAQCKRVRLNCPCCVYEYAFALKQT